jgi:hypothetical protein
MGLRKYGVSWMLNGGDLTCQFLGCNNVHVGGVDLREYMD